MTINQKIQSINEAREDALNARDEFKDIGMHCHARECTEMIIDCDRQIKNLRDQLLSA